jgi:leucine dehydrogenase
VRVAVQGVGNVGYHLAEYLYKEGADLTITDVDSEKVQLLAQKFKCKTVAVDQIYSVDADIFAPCALGAVINDETLPKLKFKIVAGGANNQLKEPRHGDALKEKGILYAPDYVINAGGLMNVYGELEGYNYERAFDMTKTIYSNLMKVFATAKEENITTYKAADRVAESRIETIGRIKRSHTGKSLRAFNSLKIDNR